MADKLTQEMIEEGMARREGRLLTRRSPLLSAAVFRRGSTEDLHAEGALSDRLNRGRQWPR
jgi:hypothetical protein